MAQQCLDRGLPGPLVPRLRSLAREENASVLAVLQAALLVVLARATGQDDIAIGSVIGCGIIGVLAIGLMAVDRLGR